jgi:epoxyqueuosine reductase
MIERKEIAEFFRTRGLAFFGIVAVDIGDNYQRFKEWLEQGRHASMRYLEDHALVRSEPLRLLPSAKSCVVFGLKYAVGNRGDTPGPAIAKYARIQDYHRVLRRSGEEFLRYLRSAGIGFVEGRILVDSAPLLERVLASQTESLFIGKNTLAINPREGSFILLAEAFLDLELPLDIPEPKTHVSRSKTTGGCGSCKRCQVHCPTGALNSEYQIDAGKCLSYWTIEHRGLIPTEYWRHLEKYWYGCDICQDVCPYNRARSPVSPMIGQLKHWQQRDLFQVATMDQAQYEAWFGGFALTRAKREGLMRNALIALWATRDRRLKSALTFALNSELEILKGTALQMENL